MITPEDVGDLLESYAAAWAANDSKLIVAHWDRQDPEPFYKAEEIPHYYHRYEDILDYWRNNEQAHAEIRLKFGRFTMKALQADLAVVFVPMRWDIRFATPAATSGPAAAHAGKAMGGENHVLTLMRRTEQGLKLAGWSETPDAPITYVRRLYEWAADPGLAPEARRLEG